MKKSIIFIIVVLMFIGCSGYRFQSPVTKTPKPEVVEKKVNDDVLVDLLSKKSTDDEVELQLRALLLNGGQIEKRERDSERFLDGRSFSFEKWLVVDTGGNYHAVIIENRILKKVKALNRLEDWDNYKPFWQQYQPVGGWKK